MSMARLTSWLLVLLLSTAAIAQDIVLPAPSDETAADTAAKPAAPAVEVTPAIRDGAAHEAAETAAKPELARVSGLAPVSDLPDQIGMGASLPQPGILRLTGEVAAITLALELPADAAPPQGLRLDMRSAINILPDTALMQVTVNDAAPVNLPLRNFGDFQPVDLPAASLKPGTNRIAIALRQPHRVFCGPDASFAVWTELNLVRSGAVLADTAAPSAQDFGRALQQQARAGLPLTVLAPQGTDPSVLRQLTDALAGAMQKQTDIQIRDPYDIAPRPGASVLLVQAGAPQLGYRLNGRGAPVMTVAYRDATLPDMAEALQALAPLESQAGVGLLSPDRRITLAQLGQGDIVGNTHYFRQDIPFRLPDDWLLLANQRARLDLHYGYADTLPQGAILLVKVNDQTVRLLPLDRDGGKLLAPLPIGFAARLLHAGLNRLSFEMMVPGNPPDIACPPRQTEMLVIARDSSLMVPRSPAMRLPGLGKMLSGLSAPSVKADPQAADPARMQRAAAQLAARLGPAAQPDPAASLLVTDFSTLPDALADVSLRALQEALFPEQPPVATPAQPAATFRLSEAAPATPEADVRPARSWSPLAWVEGVGARIGQAAFLDSDESLSEWLGGRRGDALLVALDRSQPQALGLVLGPDAQIRGIGQALAALRSSGQGHGSAALLSNDGSWQLWSPVAVPRLHEPVTAMNLLPILGNYASWSPFLFACALLGLGLISVLPALAIVIVYRKRRLR